MCVLRPRYFVRGVLLTFACMAVGCGSGDGKRVVIGQVSGRVTLDGEPVMENSALVFMPTSAGAEIGSGVIGDDGTYVAASGKHKGLPVGDYRVIVTPPRLDPQEAAELEKKNTQIVMGALIKKDRKELDKVEYPQDAFVPRKYWTESTSGLALTVKEGENSADFELTSPKK